jgi:hypothetical protein
MTEIEKYELQRALAPFVFDGTEAMTAISALVTACSEHSHPQALIGGIRRILVRQYSGAIPLDAILDYLDGGAS